VNLVKEYQRKHRTPSAVPAQHRLHRATAAPLVAQQQNGLYGGLFVNRAQAIKYALFENGRHPRPSSTSRGIELISGKRFRRAPPTQRVDPPSSRKFR
jgi:hypothetical protein